eukprot:3038754-Amphidinium_carterae.2
MLYLQLPQEGAKNAGERRPIALLPQVYRLWCAACRQDVRAWRARCTGRDEVPVGRGALDDVGFMVQQWVACLPLTSRASVRARLWAKALVHDDLIP